MQWVHRKFKGVSFITKERKREKGWDDGRKDPLILELTARLEEMHSQYLYLILSSFRTFRAFVIKKLGYHKLAAHPYAIALCNPHCKTFINILEIQEDADSDIPNPLLISK